MGRRQKMKRCAVIFIWLVFAGFSFSQSVVQIARLKYGGGGDWYNDPSAEVNLLKFIEKNTNVKTKAEYVFADASSADIFNYPILFATGHGNMNLSDAEVENLREYLTKGGFLYVDDDYGLDKYFRREIKKIFPNKKLVELPFDYGMYHVYYDFPFGPPKIHEHDGKPPQGFGIFIGKRLAVYYTYESNPSDGWADPEVHHDPKNIREQALKFGTNLVLWAITQ